jgi:hypothetical protein
MVSKQMLNMQEILNKKIEIVDTVNSSFLEKSVQDLISQKCSKNYENEIN